MMGKRQDRIRHIVSLVGVACGLALIVGGVFAWHPWDMGSKDAAADEEVFVVDDTGVEDTGGTAPEDGDDSGEATAEDEAWPGQSKGYVGPNGEGVVKREDYASDEEYMAAADASVKERNWDWSGFSWVTNDEGVRYFQGKIQATFYRIYGEARAHEIVEALGGVWLEDHFAWDTGMEWARVILCFPKDADVFAIAEELDAMPEVNSAYPTIYCPGQAEGTGASAEALFANDIMSSNQDFLSISRFEGAWGSSKCNASVSIAVLDTRIETSVKTYANTSTGRNGRC